MKLKIDSWMGSLGVASAAGLLALGVACSRDAGPVSVQTEERPVVSSPEGASLEEQVLNAYGSPSPDYATATSVPTPTLTPAAVPTVTPEPTATYTPTPSPTATSTPAPSPTLTPTVIPTATSVPTVTPEPTATYTPTPSPTATSTPAPSPTLTPTVIPTPTYTPTPTPEPTLTPTLTPTAMPTPTSTPTPAPSPVSPSYVKWNFGDEVSERQKHVVRLGVGLMHDYAKLIGMPEIKKDVAFHVYHNFDNLVDAYSEVIDLPEDRIPADWLDRMREYRGFAYDRHVFINASELDKVHEPFQVKLSAHELVHAQTAALITILNTFGSDGIPHTGPIWLTEGVADFLAWQALSEGGVKPYGEIRDLILQNAQRHPRSLERLEKRDAFNSRYNSGDHSILAVELLASRTGQGSLFDYYVSLKPGTTWRGQFQETFGVGVGEFYGLFAEHQKNGFPEAELPR